MNISGVSLAGTRHVALFKGRYKYIYGVDGSGRGFRWDGSSAAQPIGLKAPTAAPSISSVTATTSNVVSVAVVTGGNGYYNIPSVVFKGGGLADGASGHAKARAVLRNGAVSSVVITSGGTGYSSTPTIEFSGGMGSGATLAVTASGKVSLVELTGQGTGYTAGATVTFYGVNNAVGVVDVDTDTGKVTGVRVLGAGTGATTSITCAISGASGATGAGGIVIPAYEITGVGITNAGSGYPQRTNIRFVSPKGGGAAGYLTASTVGGTLMAATMTSKGSYEVIPTAVPDVSHAVANPVMREPQKGDYRCAIRYVDSTAEDDGGPIPSDITDLVTVDATGGKQSFSWSWSNSGADARADYVELWRTSANQAIVLYRVAKLGKVAGSLPTSYTDTLSEDDLVSPTRADYALMPITLPSGQLNARRFGVPPSDMEDACWFQDRAWYGVNTDGARPNVLAFSEIDEPESVPEVNEIVVQENTGDQDRVIGLIPFGSMLVVAQERHIYRLMYVSQPVIDASITLLGYRGLLNKRCWSSFEGVVYCVDSFGVYAFDGQTIDPISVAVDNYWRDSIIDFSKSKNFFVQADPQSRVVRFHYCQAADGVIPSRALCYSLSTKAWWEETYAQGIGSACVVRIAGKQSVVAGASSGHVLKVGSGLTDFSGASSVAIPYQLRTGPMPIADEPSREVGVLYQPTASTATLAVKLHYNNSTTPRPNAIASDRGDGVQASTAGATIDLRTARSPLGNANGVAIARYSGRFSDLSSGGDRHLAIDLSGSQSGAAVTLHSLTVGGVTG